MGDLHGSPVWKQIRVEEWDRMVFIGDPSGETSVTYVDCLDMCVEFYQLNLPNEHV